MFLFHALQWGYHAGSPFFLRFACQGPRVSLRSLAWTFHELGGSTSKGCENSFAQVNHEKNRERYSYVPSESCLNFRGRLCEKARSQARQRERG